MVHLRRLLTLENLLAAGRIGKGSLGLDDRIPLKAPLDGVEGHPIRNVIVTRSEWPDFRLSSGEVMCAQFIGVTDPERDCAVEAGTSAIVELLTSAGASPVIIPDRASNV